MWKCENVDKSKRFSKKDLLGNCSKKKKTKDSFAHKKKGIVYSRGLGSVIDRL